MSFIDELERYGINPFDFSQSQQGPTVPTSWNRESSIYGQAVGVGSNVASEIASTERALQMGSLNAADRIAAQQYLQSLRMQASRGKDDSMVGTPGFNPNEQLSVWEQMKRITAGSSLQDAAITGELMDESERIPNLTDYIKSKLGFGLQNVGFGFFGIVLVVGAVFVAYKMDAVGAIKKAV